MPLSNLTAYTTIPENSAATPGLFDSRYQTLDANIRAVDNTVSLVSTSLSLVSGSGISGFRDVTTARFGGAIGDGTTDDRGAFNTGSSSVLTQASLYVPSAASVYRFASSVTLNGTLYPIRGAILRPVSGATVYIDGEIAKGTGSYPIFDSSLGGGFSFTSQREFNAAWFGVAGDGVTDDAPAMNAISSFVPSFSRVYFDKKMDIALYSTWTTESKQAIAYESRVPAVQDALGVNLVWRGAYGGAMVFWNRSQHLRLLGIGVKLTSGCYYGAGASIASSQRTVTFNGFAQADPSWVGKWVLVRGAGVAGADLITTVQAQTGATQITLAAAASSAVSIARYIIGSTATSGPPLVGLDIDMVPSNGLLTTECEASENLFNGLIHGQIAIRVANTSVNNCEFMQFCRNKFFGGWTSPAWLMPISNLQSCSINLGTPTTVTGTFAGFFIHNYIGLRIRVAGAGVAGALLDTFITAVAGDGTSCTIATAASTAVTGARCKVSEGVGIGIQVGDHSNAMRHRVEDNGFEFLQYGVDHQNGSMLYNGNTGSDNEVDFYLKSNSNPLVMIQNQSEAAGQHIAGPNLTANNDPIILLGPRLGTSICAMNAGFIAFGPGTKNVHCIGVGFDDLMAPDATYWDLFQMQGKIAILNTQYTVSAGATTMALAGYTRIAATVGLLSSREQNITDAPAETFTLGGQHYVKGSDSAIPALWGEADNGVSGTVTGVRGTVRGDVASGSGGQANAVEGQIIVPFGVDRDMAAFRAKGLTWSTGASASASDPVQCFVAESPVITNGQIHDLYGVRIKKQNDSRVVNPYGIWQEDTGDPNLFAGLTTFGTQSLMTVGTALLPGYAFSSESSLGFYRSGVSTIAPSFGTLNLASNNVRLSLRTQTSLDSTNLAVNEFAITINGSGATAAYRSNGTIYYWTSSASTKG